MSGLVRKMQLRLRRSENRFGKRGFSAADKTGTKLGIPPKAVTATISACRGTRRGKHREGFSVGQYLKQDLQ